MREKAKGADSMSSKVQLQPRKSAIYTEQDYIAISAQLKKRWLIAAIPCVLLLAVLVYSLVIRQEWLTTTCTILIGVILIAGYDLFIKPIACYRTHLSNVLYGRARESMLPFLAISEDVNVVDGVAYRSVTCQDVDGKGRLYERLFYFDAAKTFPEFQTGDMLRIVHHDLVVADIAHA